MRKKKDLIPERTAFVPFKFPDLQPMTEGRKVKVDKLYAIVYLIMLTWWRMKRNKKLYETIDRTTGWVPIDSDKVLKKMFSNSYKSHIRFLVEKGLIEIRKKPDTGKEGYMTNKYCKLYRINPEYMTQKGRMRYRKVQIKNQITLKGIHRLIEIGRTKSEALLNARPDIHYYKPLIEFEQRLKLDENAIQMDLEAGMFKRKMKWEYPGIANAYNSGSYSGNWNNARVCSYGERLHQPLSRLNKELRPYLYDPKRPSVPLVELDIKNSQPYHLSAIMINPDLIDRFVSEFYPIKLYLTNRVNRADIKQFHYTCADGKIYEQWIKTVFGNEKPNDSAREISKNQLFGPIMFGRVESLSKNPGHVFYLKKTKALFASVYPNVWENLVNMKWYGGLLPFLSEYYKKGVQEYKSVSCLAQRLESRILIKFIAPLLRLNGVKEFTTLHDSFILSANDAETAKKVIQDYYRSLNLWPPSISLKTYHTCDIK